MWLYPSDRYPLPLPPGHRFPAAKYAAIRQRLESQAAAGVLLEFIEPHAATDEELLRVHDRAYVGRVLSGTLTPDEVRRIGFPWSPALVERSLRSTGAVVDVAAALAKTSKALLTSTPRRCFWQLVLRGNPASIDPHTDRHPTTLAPVPFIQLLRHPQGEAWLIAEFQILRPVRPRGCLWSMTKSLRGGRSRRACENSVGR